MAVCRDSAAVWHGDDLRMRLSGAAVHRGDDALHVSGRERIAEIGTDGGDDLIRTYVFREERVRMLDAWLGACDGTDGRGDVRGRRLAEEQTLRLASQEHRHHRKQEADAGGRGSSAFGVALR